MRADAPGAAAHSARLAFAASAVAKPGGSAVSPPVVQPAGDAPEPGGMDKRCRVRGTGSPGASRTQRAPSSQRKGPGGRDAQKMVPDPRREELNVAGAGVTCCSCPAPPRAAQPAPSTPAYPQHPQAPLCESSSPHVLHACARGCTPGTAQQTLILAERRGGSCSSPAPRAACALSAGPVRAIGCKTPGWVLCGVLAVVWAVGRVLFPALTASLPGVFHQWASAAPGPVSL